SLKKLTLTEPGSFNKAKINILFTILIFTLIKLLIAGYISYINDQTLQLYRALVMFTIGVILLKLLLFNKNYTHIIAQIIVWTGLLFIWSNVFIFTQDINIITLQSVFMIILSSFYLLGARYGIVYSLLSISPLILYLIKGNSLPIITVEPDQLASPGFEIIVVLSLITFVIIHYLYHEAFKLNVAEKELLNDQLKQAVEEANLAAESKSDFLSTMSHELRTPLNSVIGMTELMLDNPYNKEQAENLKILNFSAVNLHSLINDILDYNKLGADKLNLEAINVNLYQLMNDICLGLRMKAKEKGLELRLNIDEILKEKPVITDPTRITQIIYNLVGNAIKFTNKGSVSVSLKVIKVDDDNLNIRFSIIDTGIGISEDNQQSIFEPFTQASTSTTRNFGGTGLGLAIVKRLLLLFNTTIHLESAAGTGSNFFFNISFPLQKEQPVSNSVAPELNYDLEDIRVLVAEDNPMNRLLLKKVFFKWNNEPEFAENGMEAVEKLKSHSYDIVLMDIHMPVMDGYEATKVIRNMSDPEKANIPVIALTASVSNNLRDKIREAGMNDYVYKPFNSKELYSKIKSMALQSEKKPSEMLNTKVS
ncbi:MAG TPA: ATP-binding protein, partial [Sphingobacteriaceae bacterium]